MSRAAQLRVPGWMLALVALTTLGVAAVALTVVYIRFIVPLDPGRVRRMAAEPTIVLIDRDDRKLATRLAPGPRVDDLLAQARDGNRGARHVVDAVIAIEDKQFWTLGGVELLPLAKAVLADGRGGSTITMQLIKNVYFGSGASTDRTRGPGARLERKLQEILFSPDLDGTLSRQEILGVYLRQAPDFDRARGIEAASMLFFGVYPEELSAAQAAMLAATFKAPYGYDPRNIGWEGRMPPPQKRSDGTPVYAANAPLGDPAECGAGAARLRNNRCRALLILAQMREQTRGGPGETGGTPMLTEAEYNQARRETLTAGVCDSPFHMAEQRAVGLLPPNEGLCRRTPRQFIALALAQTDALGAPARPGLALEVATTFDRRAHAAAADAIDALRRCRFPPSETGIAVVSPGGAVRAIIEAPAQGFAAPGDENEPAAGLPPGSTLKPFLFAAWLDRVPGASPATALRDDDEAPPRARSAGFWLQDKGRPWWPNRGRPPAVLSAADALAFSRNRPVIRIGAEIGPEPLAAMFARAGLSFHGRPGRAGATAPHAFPTRLADKWPMALLGEGGAAGVRPAALAAAYGAFHNGGATAPPHLLRSVTYVAPDGRRRAFAALAPPAPRAIMSSTTAAEIDAMLAQVPARGTAAGLDRLVPGARGKTGTASGARYGWFVGYAPGTPDVVAAWLNAPPVAVRLDNGAEPTIRLAVDGRDAALLFAATMARLDGAGLGTPPPDLCPASSRKLDRGLGEQGAPARRSSPK